MVSVGAFETEETILNNYSNGLAHQRQGSSQRGANGTQCAREAQRGPTEDLLPADAESP